MKFHKKLSALVLASALVLGSTYTAFAATPADIISSLQSAGISSSQLATTENYLKSNQIDASKLDIVKSKIDAVTALKKSKGVQSVSDLSASDKAIVLKNIQSAASTIGLSASLSTSGGKTFILFTDSNGREIASFSTSVSNSTVTGVAMKTTGTENGDLIAIGGAMIVLSIAGLTLRKKTLN